MCTVTPLGGTHTTLSLADRSGGQNAGEQIQAVLFLRMLGIYSLSLLRGDGISPAIGLDGSNVRKPEVWMSCGATPAGASPGLETRIEPWAVLAAANMRMMSSCMFGDDLNNSVQFCTVAWSSEGYCMVDAEF